MLPSESPIKSPGKNPLTKKYNDVVVSERIVDPNDIDDVKSP